MSPNEDKPPFLAYGQTQGFVNRPASVERAFNEVISGDVSERQKRVLRRLEILGNIGGTYRELGEVLGLHHGQISGVLTNLHAAGKIVMLGKKRNRCHVYVLPEWSDWAKMLGEQVFASPVRTKAKENADNLRKLLDAIEGCKKDSWHSDSVRWLEFVAWEIQNPVESE